MRAVKIAVSIVGVLMTLMGLLWIGQGLNIIRWPETSFMIGDPRWSWNGTALAVAGAILAWWGARRG